MIPAGGPNAQASPFPWSTQGSAESPGMKPVLDLQTSRGQNDTGSQGFREQLSALLGPSALSFHRVQPQNPSPPHRRLSPQTKVLGPTRAHQSIPSSYLEAPLGPHCSCKSHMALLSPTLTPIPGPSPGPSPGLPLACEICPPEPNSNLLLGAVLPPGVQTTQPIPKHWIRAEGRGTERARGVRWGRRGSMPWGAGDSARGSG